MAGVTAGAAAAAAAAATAAAPGSGGGSASEKSASGVGVGAIAAASAMDTIEAAGRAAAVADGVAARPGKWVQLHSSPEEALVALGSLGWKFEGKWVQFTGGIGCSLFFGLEI